MLWVVHFFERRRSATIQDFARRLGLAFKKEAGNDFYNTVTGFSLFSRGYGTSVRNLLHGYRDNAEITLFEYYFVENHGQSIQNFNLTVLLLRSKYLGLPYFSLCPEDVFHKLEEIIGQKDIDFDSHPQFSKYYVLTGPDENAVRKLFNDNILNYLENNKGLCIEGLEDHLLVYRKGIHISPERFQSLLFEGLTVLRLFESAS